MFFPPAFRLLEVFFNSRPSGESREKEKVHVSATSWTHRSGGRCGHIALTAGFAAELLTTVPPTLYGDLHVLPRVEIL